MMQTLIPAFSGIFLPIILGLISRRSGFIPAENRAVIQQFAVRIGIPFMVFNSLRTMDISTAGQFLPMSLAYVVFTITSWFLSFVIFSLIIPKSSWFSKYKAELLLMAFAGNIGYICWKLHELLAGPEGLQRGIFYTTLVWPTLMGTAFLTVFVYKLNQSKKMDKKNVLFNLIPLLSMMTLGLILGIHKIEIPVWLGQFTAGFGNMAVPVILFCMGLSISIKGSFRSIFSLIPYLLIRQIIWITVMFIISLLPYFDDVSRKVLFINAFAPLGVNPIVISDMFGLDSEFVANAITISTLLFLFSLPFLFIFWSWMS